VFRRVLLAATMSLVLVLPAGAVSASPCWRPPVIGVLIDRFREPPCPYCAGNRGLEYRVGGRAAVSAVAAGEVTWVGQVAGVRYVVVGLANGWQLTYGRLASTPLRRGDRVVSGSIVGRAERGFYFGLRVDGRYRDPEPYLGRLVGRPRLIPVDGAAARPAPPPRLRCGA